MRDIWLIYKEYENAHPELVFVQELLSKIILHRSKLVGCLGQGPFLQLTARGNFFFSNFFPPELQGKNLKHESGLSFSSHGPFRYSMVKRQPFVPYFKMTPQSGMVFFLYGSRIMLAAQGPTRSKSKGREGSGLHAGLFSLDSRSYCFLNAYLRGQCHRRA
jgi:hypothetical protein